MGLRGGSKMKKILLVIVSLHVAVGLGGCNLLRDENIVKAQKCYEKGEKLFEQKRYKEAMLNYQKVQEFYYLPHSHWVDLAQEKEWICRAYLRDWIPPEGAPADVRKIRAPEYEKYKKEIAQITP